jgi:transcriptional regulator with XRE-family HTH domain
MSQVQLAKEMGIPQPVLNAMLKGKRRFNENYLLAISTALDISLAELFQEDFFTINSSTVERIQRLYPKIKKYRNGIDYFESQVYDNCKNEILAWKGKKAEAERLAASLDALENQHGEGAAMALLAEQEGMTQEELIDRLSDSIEDPDESIV